MSSKTMIKIPHKELHEGLENAFSNRLENRLHAKQMANALTEASLMGVDTHGASLFPVYWRELNDGRANRSPQFNLKSQSAAIQMLDCDNASGPISGFFASQHAAKSAEILGLAAVVASHSNHFGAAGLYALEIAKTNKIGICISSAAKRVFAHKGAESLFGTNPLAIAIPLLEDRFFLLDMATSQISYSRVKKHRASGLSLEENWAANFEGGQTIDPHQAFGLLPLGGYKGQGLAMMISFLTAGLSGMPFDDELCQLDEEPFSRPRKISHTFFAIDLSFIGNANDFKRRADSFVHRVRSSRSVKNNKVEVAGDPQWKNREIRQKEGVPIETSLWNTILNPL